MPKKLLISTFSICLISCSITAAFCETTGDINKKLTESEIKQLGDDYDKYIKQPEKLQEIGLIFERQGDYDQAIGIYLDILKRFPKYKDSRYIRDLVKDLRNDQRSDYQVTLTRKEGKITDDEEFMELRATCFAMKAPIKVYIHRPGKIKGYRPKLEIILKESLQEWESATKGRVKFKLVNTAKEADIECTFTDRQEDLKSFAAAGTTEYGGVGRSKVRILTMLYGKPISDRLGIQCSLHEIGHSLGLSHSRNANDIMCGFAPEETFPTTLSKTDIDRCMALYSAEHTNNTKAKLDKKVIELLKYANYLSRDKKDNKKAVQYLEKVFDIDRDNIDALILSSDIQFRLGNYDKCVNDLTKALNSEPERKRTILPQRALVQIKRKNFKLAMEDFKGAIESQYSNPLVYAGFAITRLLALDDLDVLNDLNEAIRRSSFDPQLYRARSLVYYLNSNRSKAIEDSETYLKLNNWRKVNEAIDQSLFLYYLSKDSNENALQLLMVAKDHCKNPSERYKLITTLLGHASSPNIETTFANQNEQPTNSDTMEWIVLERPTTDGTGKDMKATAWAKKELEKILTNQCQDSEMKSGAFNPY